MKLEQWLKTATKKLETAGIGTARLDSLVLLEDELAKDKAWLLAHSDFQLASQTIVKLNKKLARRLKHEPLAYVRGFTEFYGRRFKVNRRVLEPRPESEAMIELLKEGVESGKWKVESKLRIADIGTGSGALAITAKLELPRSEVVGVDIDANCLKIARQNAKQHGVKIEFLQGDLLQPLLSTVHSSLSTVLLANLPYVPRNFYVNQAAAMEPRLAIFGGRDGLGVYRRLFEQLKDLEARPKYVLTEALPPQHPKLAAIAASVGYQQSKSADFIQLFVVG